MPLLGIYPGDTIIQKDTCTPMSIPALFTVGTTWKRTLMLGKMEGKRRSGQQRIRCLNSIRDSMDMNFYKL